METATLADQVKAARSASGMTQFDLSVAAGVSLTVVRNIEQGITKDPRYSTVQALLAAISSHDPDASGSAESTPPNDHAALASSAKKSASAA